MNRRLFLLGGIACFSTFALSKPAHVTSAEHKEPLLFSACTNHNDQHFIAALTINGTLDFLISVPERAHDSCYLPSKNHVVFFGRSPSKRIYIVDLHTKSLIRQIEAKPDRHFYGHGVVDFNGYLYVTENNVSKQTGLIGIYDTERNYQKVAEYSSYGIEPHQLQLMPDQKTLVIANGGLIKDPDNNKKILNKKGFESSVTYMDTETGKLRDKFISPHNGNSLRHLTVSKTGNVFIGAQSHRNEILPLIYKHSGSESLQSFDAEEYIWQSHQKYTAGLSLSHDILAVTSPRGNVVSFWDSQSGQWLRQERVQDVAGIAGHSDIDPIILTSGTGCYYLYKYKENSYHEVCHQLYWDNHLSLAALK